MKIASMENLTINTNKKTAGSYDKQVNIAELVMEDPGAVYAMLVNSNIMSDAGINKGDQVIVDRNKLPVNGNIIIARIGNDLCIRKMLIEDGRRTLVSPGVNLAPLAVDKGFDAWGVVIYVLKKIA